MGARQELEQLLAELKNTRSPVGRVKLLARGWRIVRDLDPSQRHQLARRLGIDGAEEWLDRSAGARRLERPWLAKLLRKARTLEVDELRSRARSLRDPGARGELLRRGVDALADEFSGTEAAATLEVVEAAGAEEAQETPLELPDSPRPVADLPEPRTRAPVAVVAPAADTRPTKAVPAPTTGPPRPVTAEQAPAAPAAAAVSSTLAKWPAAAGAPPQPKPSPREPDRAGRAVEIADQIRNSPPLALQFRLLRQHLGDLREASPDQLRALIESFPSGWARRRALASLLRHRIPDSLHRAVFLIESLETDLSRRWCVATLLTCWNLSPAERATLIERDRLLRFRARRRVKAFVADRVAPPA